MSKTVASKKPTKGSSKTSAPAVAAAVSSPKSGVSKPRPDYVQKEYPQTLRGLRDALVAVVSIFASINLMHDENLPKGLKGTLVRVRDAIDNEVEMVSNSKGAHKPSAKKIDGLIASMITLAKQLSFYFADRVNTAGTRYGARMAKVREVAPDVAAANVDKFLELQQVLESAVATDKGPKAIAEAYNALFQHLFNTEQAVGKRLKEVRDEEEREERLGDVEGLKDALEDLDDILG